MNYEQKLIDVFAYNCECFIQHKGSPCGTCFHSQSDNIDYQHISWLLLLWIRGDYNTNNDKQLLLDSIREELRKE